MTPDSVPSTLLPLRHVLSNGLQVGFIQLPTGSQAAALVRVHAGAHDAPSQYPGLAHFLEHLLFLGSHAYGPSQSLMPFVQGCAGLLNASTRERHTDFFFQVSPAAFDEALKRLLDMLARPLLDPAAQLREREVLQAEFLARGRDRETLCDAAIGTALTTPHPFSAFHAGNRDTLPVELLAFQQALQGYHRRFYHAEQMELLVAAPCSLEQLIEVLSCVECQLPAAPLVARPVPPLRADDGATLQLKVDAAKPCLAMAFALDDLPEGVAVALDVLRSCLASQANGSFFAAMREAHWCDALGLRTPYWHAGQGVVVLEFQLTEQGMADRGQLVAAARGWLHFMTSQAPWSELWSEYVHIRQRELLGKEPLALLRYWIDPGAWSPSTNATDVQHAFRTLGTALHGCEPIILTVDDSDGDGHARIATKGAGFALQVASQQLPIPDPRAWQWQLPERNPWLSERVQPRTAPVLSPSLCWLEHGDGASGQGALYVRWRLSSGQPAAGLWHVLNAALRTHTHAAAQAGVEVRFEDHGRSWCLSLVGHAEAAPIILRDLLRVLKAPPASAFDEGSRLLSKAETPCADEILIRQLLRRIPALLEPMTSVDGLPLHQAGLDQLWLRSHWDALAVGFSVHLSGPLQDVLDAVPGMPDLISSEQAAGVPRYQWSRFGEPGEETALVLFCPLPDRMAATEAAWRQLSRLMEGAFFRRLRSELQLGYAVFCGFRQFGERPGIVFAVQSPSASAPEILGHIEAFLEAFAGNLAAQTTAASLDSASLSEQSADLRRHAERIWQARLAGGDNSHPAAVNAAMAVLQVQDMRDQLHALRSAIGGWCVVANADAPDARWQQR